MGKNNRQHRAAKAKSRRQRDASPPRPRPGAEHPRLASDAVRAAVGADQQRQQALEVLAALARRAATVSATDLPRSVHFALAPLAPELLLEVEKVLVAELMVRVAAAWQHGWQPADLSHAAVKRGVRQAGLVAELITRQAQVIGAHRRAPQAWRDQLDLIAGSVSSAPTGEWQPVTGLVADGVPAATAWADALGLLKTLAELSPLPHLMPPPSQWDRMTPAATRTGSADRDRMLTRIRALLAKAEATDHPAEAETFTAKAQELMSRHAIDEALLHAGEQESIALLTRRVHLSSPYASTKVLLLSAVAEANRSRAIYLSAYAIASIVGTPVDIDQIELLYTSLLIQATRAMAAAGKNRAGSFDRSSTFRRSFLTAYAHRIGERLTEADRETVASYGAELVPVLQRQADAIDAEFNRQFPRTTTINTGTLDARGWNAGRAAADDAVLVAGRLEN